MKERRRNPQDKKEEEYPRGRNSAPIYMRRMPPSALKGPCRVGVLAIKGKSLKESWRRRANRGSQRKSPYREKSER